jgi:hypothetical protein
MKGNEILLHRLMNKNQALELQAKTSPNRGSQKENFFVAFNGFSNLHPKAVLIVYNWPTLIGGQTSSKFDARQGPTFSGQSSNFLSNGRRYALNLEGCGNSFSLNVISELTTTDFLSSYTRNVFVQYRSETGKTPPSTESRTAAARIFR